MRYLFFILFLLFFHQATAQNGDNATRLSLFYEQIRDMRKTSIYQSGGVSFEVFLFDEDLVSINYNLSFGHHNQNGFLVHYPLGIYMASYPLSLINTGGNNDWIFWAALLCIIIPESVNLHFKLSNEIFVSPYFSPAGMDTWWDNGRAVAEPTLGMGIRFNVIKDNQWTLSPFAGVKSHYSNISWNQVQFGCMIGVGF